MNSSINYNEEPVIYLIHDGLMITEKSLCLYKSWLSSTEHSQLNSFRFAKHQKEYLLTRALVRYIIGGMTHVEPAKVAFTHNEYGKPSLQDNKSISFNLSHSGGAVVLAVCKERDIGIDIELATSNRAALDIADDFFSLSECQLLRNYPEQLQHKMFFKLWTLKEAYIKACGKGLSTPLHSFSFSLQEHCQTLALQTSDTDLTKRWHFIQATVLHDYELAIGLKNGASLKAVSTFEIVPGVSIRAIELEINHKM
jgi:4'-phosphopantetheinyl transferase